MRTIIFILAISSCLQAQVSQRKKLYLAPSFYKLDIIYSDTRCLALYDRVEKALSQTQRYQIVNNKSLNEVFSGTFESVKLNEIEASQIQKAKENGAQFVGFILINSLTTRAGSLNQMGKLANPLKGFYADLDFTLKIVDMERGLIVLEEVFGVKGHKTKVIPVPKATEEEAVLEAIAASEATMNEYFKKFWPQSFEIFKVEKESKRSVGEVIVTIGSYYKSKKGLYLDVCEVDEVELGGKLVERRNKIASLVVENVEDANFSRCSVKVGGQEIKDAINAKKTLKVYVN